MTIHKWSDRRAKMSPEMQKEIAQRAEEHLVEMNLFELRRATGLTQVELAARAEMAQAELSRIERRDDHLLSTLRRYVGALGGELEVVAIIGDKRVTLCGV
jgi:predicted transcriptional regulator